MVIKNKTLKMFKLKTIIKFYYKHILILINIINNIIDIALCFQPLATKGFEVGLRNIVFFNPTFFCTISTCFKSITPSKYKFLL